MKERKQNERKWIERKRKRQKAENKRRKDVKVTMNE
jgi:hypothetical protein